MASFLVAYGTGEGQTARVAEQIAETLTSRGHEATTFDVEQPPPDLAPDDYDAVLVGASIHAGSHQPAVIEFVTASLETLERVPTAFFQVSLSSAQEEGRDQAAGYVEHFVDETGWHPDRIGQFGGALRFSEYGFLKRALLKQIAKRTLTDVDTSGDVEFTDWAAVEAFAADVAAFVEGRLGVTPPTGEGDTNS